MNDLENIMDTFSQTPWGKASQWLVVLFLLIVKAYPNRLQELKTQFNHQNYHFPQKGGSVGLNAKKNLKLSWKWGKSQSVWLKY